MIVDREQHDRPDAVRSKALLQQTPGMIDVLFRVECAVLDQDGLAGTPDSRASRAISCASTAPSR